MRTYSPSLKGCNMGICLRISRGKMNRVRLSPHRRAKFLATALAIVASSFIAANGARAQPCTTTAVNVGYRDVFYGTGPYKKPTSEKPEHKLWYVDGTWWGSLWDTSKQSYRIHRLDLTNQCWVSVGPNIDARGETLADALWDGQKLYIASHVSSNSGAYGPAQLYRYSYDFGTQSFALDSGFPVEINPERSEALTIDKDSTGKLWITWTRSRKIWVNRSLGDDLIWGQPFALSGSGTTVAYDDISAIVAFSGNKMGILWSNQNDEVMYFAIHQDGDPDTDWTTIEEAYANSSLGAVADDHINIKILSDADGNVYASTKTSLSGSNDPLIVLLKRTAGGTWRQHTVSKKKYNHTRPILMIDETNRELYVFMTKRKVTPQAIYYKKTDLDNISFATGDGTLFIKADAADKMNDPTSTRQSVSSASGIVVLASDEISQYYYHNHLALPGPPPPAAPTSLAASAVSTSQIDLTWTDNANNENGFRIERREGAGSFAPVDSVGSDVTGYQDVGLQPNTVYTYRVLAYNGGGDSGYSNEAGTATLPEMVLVTAKVFLEGPFDAGAGEMAADLSAAGLIPTISPYADDPRQAGAVAGEITDWVLVQLRSSATGSAVASKSAFLRKDGRIVADDGSTAEIQLDAPPGDYFIVVKQRNHLAVMSANAVPLSASIGTLYDFTASQAAAYGTNALKEVATGTFAMLAGDGNAGGDVDALDRNLVWRPENGTHWTYQKYGDFNLDGSIDAIDRNLYWRANNGAATQVP